MNEVFQQEDNRPSTIFIISMDALRTKLSDVPAPVVTSVAVGAGLFIIYNVFFGTKKSLREKYEKDVVYLHQFPRSSTVPNVSPFCLKVETFLRINGIKYQSVYSTSARSEQGFLPYVVLNGKQIDDSELILHKLSKEFRIQALTPRDEALSHAVSQLADHHLFYIVMKYKVLAEEGFDFCSGMLRDIGVDKNLPAFVFNFLASRFTSMLRSKARARISAGLSMFPDEDFDLLLHKDLDSIRDILGDQKFLFGDKPTASDCTVFGQLASAYYLPCENEISRIIKREYPTIQLYLNSVRDAAFGKDFAL